MKHLRLVLMMAVAGLMLASCSLDDDGSNFRYVALETIDAELPDAFELGQVYEIKVTYQLPNDCTQFEGFDVTRDQEEQTTRYVLAVGAEIYDNDSECTENIVEQTRSFDFEVIYEEDYTFKFWAGEDADGEDIYIEYIVPVTTS